LKKAGKGQVFTIKRRGIQKKERREGVLFFITKLGHHEKSLTTKWGAAWLG